MTDRTPTILEACDDPALFGFDLWPAQRELLVSIEAGPRLHVWCLGRRSGKTTLAALVALHASLFRPDLDVRVRPGERRYSVAVATTHQQARLIVRAALSVVERSPLLADTVERLTEDVIEFRNGTALAAFPASSRGGRGWPISTLVLDEAAHMLDSEGYQAGERLFTALAPSTAQFGDAARVIVSSTPYGTGGFFADLFHRVEDGSISDAKATRLATADVNPTIDAPFLARERERDPDAFRGEYLAEFVGSGGQFLDPARFEVAERGELEPGDCAAWIAGLDPAFSSDPFGLALVGRDPVDRARLRLGLVRGFKPERRPASFEQRREIEDTILGDVAAICQRYGVTRAVTDQYAAPAVLARLRAAGVPVTTIPMTAASKTAAYQELRARLYDASLELFDHPGLSAELQRLRTRFTAGAAAVENPRMGGAHGDMAQALAIAVYAVRGSYGSAPAGFRSSRAVYSGPEGRSEPLATVDGVPLI